MSAAAPTRTDSDSAAAKVGAEPWSAWAAWAADELGVRLGFDGKHYLLEVPSAESPPEGRSPTRSGWFRRREKTAAEPAPDATPAFQAESPSDLVLELAERLRNREQPPEARPVHQPTAVHDLANRLFNAYKLDGCGQAHLAGCHFEDVPLVRATRIDDSGDTPVIEHRLFDELGVEVDWAQVVDLGADEVAAVAETEPTPRLDAGRLQRMVESARRSVSDDAFGAITLVWVKRAWGRLRFDFGDESVDAEFSGWARTLKAPSVVCPATGVETFHLTATDDGRIVAAEAIVVSAVSGRRLLVDDLVECQATGQLAEAEYLTPCAASGEQVLKSELRTCERCGLRVAPSAVRGGGCSACLGAQRATIKPSVWTAILTKHPGLMRHAWRTSRTGDVYLLEASGWLRRRVVTIDAESLDVTHAAEGSRFSSVWRAVSTNSYD